MIYRNLNAGPGLLVLYMTIHIIFHKSFSSSLLKLRASAQPAEQDTEELSQCRMKVKTN